MADTIRVFIGSEPKTTIMCQVLIHSIRARTHSAVEFTVMEGGAWEYDRAGIQVGTGFSLRRFLIPAFCEWKGRAIYVDADVVVFSDIGELWGLFDAKKWPDGTAALTTYQPDKFNKAPWPQSSVMVIDCEAARHQWGWTREAMLWHLRSNGDKRTYAEFQHLTWADPQPGRIADEWNHLNVYVRNKTKLLHMTKEPEQPPYRPDTPIAKVWQLELEAAIKAGAVRKSDFEAALAKWQVKDDWRLTNGCHPFYKRYLPLFPR